MAAALKSYVAGEVALIRDYLRRVYVAAGCSVTDATPLVKLSRAPSNRRPVVGP